MEFGGDRAHRQWDRHRQRSREHAIADVAAGMSLIGAAALWGIDAAVLATWVDVRDEPDNQRR